MQLIEATMTSKGQITIPKPLREGLGLKQGSEVVFIQENGKVMMMLREKEPLKAMLELRKRVKFTEEETKQMISKSKKEWSKIE